MSLGKILTVLLASLLIMPSALMAQDGEIHAKIRILPEYSKIEANQDIWIAIEQSITKGWHTYWKNPGDSGSAPRVDWDLPEGFEVSDIYWPIPEKIPYPPLLNYGYEGNTILLQKLTVPEGYNGDAVTLNADVEILVCKEECIPEFSLHNLTLNGPNASSEDNAGYIDVALQALPKKTDQLVLFYEDKGNLVINMPLSEGQNYTKAELKSMEYFPADWGLVSNTARPHAEIINNSLIITQKHGDRGIESLEKTAGVVAYTNENGIRTAFKFKAKKSASAPAYAKDSPFKLNEHHTAPGVESTTLIQALLFAILGGLVLNLMPCVFPVLSIKALSLVKISEKRARLARKHGLAYTAGVILSFLAIAAILILLKAGGASIGWGFQLQSPIVISLLAYMLFLVGLNLSGYFELGGQFGNIGQKLTQGGGLSSSFSTGVLATLVATPCTAPFMALALGYALVQPAAVALSVFAALGFGLALPYLLLSFAPALQSKLPRPGPWMETFRQFLAFPMFASAAWLAWVLAEQTGSIGVLSLTFGAVSITFGLWLVKHMPEKGFKRFILKALALLMFITPIGLIPAGGNYDHTQSINIEKMETTFSPEKLETLLAGDDPVFVEMTAAWCITCKVNHALAINTKTTKALFANNNVQYVVGDWTNYDADITEFLNSYGREGVPIYVYYGPRNAETGERPEPEILPQILTPDIVRKTIENP